MCRPFAFRAVHSVSLHGDQLRSDLRVYNLETHPVSFSAMLHSFIEVVAVSACRVVGLEGAFTTLVRSAPLIVLAHVTRAAAL